MPREAKSLSALAVKRLPSGVHSVGGVRGLHLQVRETGSRSWILRAVIGGKRREMGLGPYPEVSLADARAEAARVRALIRMGRDPITERKEARAAISIASRRGKIFSEVLDEYALQKLTGLKEEKYQSQWLGSVKKYAIPVLGNFPVKDIGLEEVLKVLQPIWSTRTETASKLQGRLERLLAFSIVMGYRSGSNPAAWKNNLSLILPSPLQVSDSQNYPALQRDDLARWWADLNGRQGMGARALEFQAMTVSRSGLVRFATWDEIDFENAIWTVQPGRKAAKIRPINQGGRPHKVPLTSEMLNLLEKIPRLMGSELIFTAPRGGPLSDATLGKVMKAIHAADVRRGGPGFLDRDTKKPAVPHGLRSTFRTWVGDCTEFDRDMAEVALSHRVGSKVAQAYDRADYIEKRRKLMERWLILLKTST